MEEKDENSGWTKPKQSFRLKRTISRKRPALSNSNNRTLPLPERSQSVKRKQPHEDGSVDSPSQSSIIAAKKQKLGEIFSPSSNFLQSSLSRTLPTNLLQRRLEFNSSLDPRGELENFSIFVKATQLTLQVVIQALRTCPAAAVATAPGG